MACMQRTTLQVSIVRQGTENLLLDNTKHQYAIRRLEPLERARVWTTRIGAMHGCAELRKTYGHRQRMSRVEYIMLVH